MPPFRDRELKREIEEKTDQIEQLASEICRWTSPVLETWEQWLPQGLFSIWSQASTDGAPLP